MSVKETAMIAEKMGITSPKVARKAKEYCQLLEIRSNSGALSSLKLPASCNTVACVELAASSLNHYVDKATAVRVSGTTKKMYMMCLKTIESILELQEVRTIRDIAVQFGCTPSVDLAQKILKKYIENQHQGADGMDFNTSLFQGAAVCAACKHQKVKVERSKIKEMCAVKRSCFDTLVEDMEKIAQSIEGEKKVTSRKRESTLLDEVERQMNDLPDKKPREEEDKENAQKTDYEEWKRKILENAARANAVN